MSEASQQRSTASFYASPAEALKAPPEELLYLACLHQGTGVERPDFLAGYTPRHPAIISSANPSLLRHPLRDCPMCGARPWP
jgi:hypothetical protein